MDMMTQTEVVYLLRVMKKAMGEKGVDEREKMGIKNFPPESMNMIREYCMKCAQKLKCGSVKDILGLRKQN